MCDNAQWYFRYCSNDSFVGHFVCFYCCCIREIIFVILGQKNVSFLGLLLHQLIVIVLVLLAIIPIKTLFTLLLDHLWEYTKVWLIAYRLFLHILTLYTIIKSRHNHCKRLWAQKKRPYVSTELLTVWSYSR